MRELKLDLRWQWNKNEGNVIVLFYRRLTLIFGENLKKIQNTIYWTSVESEFCVTHKNIGPGLKDASNSQMVFTGPVVFK